MSNFQVLQPLSDDNKKIQDFSAEQHNLELNYNQELGTVKITDDLHRLCLASILNRIDSTLQYNSSRKERIDNNWKTYYKEKNASITVENSNTVSSYSGSEAFVACHDHLDDYISIFADWEDQLDIVDNSSDAYKYISTRLKLDETDEDPKMAKLRAIFNSLSEEDKQELLNKQNTFAITDEEDTFYYQKKSAVLSFMKSIVEESGYKESAIQAYLNLIVTGHLVVRDNYSCDYRSQLTRRETGEFSVEIKRNPKARFIVVDPRNLIFSATSEWTIEKIHTTFSQLLNLCLDEKGKPVQNSQYDIDQLRKIAEYIRTNGSSQFNDKLAGQVVNETIQGLYFDQDDFTDLYNIDGNITLYEAHNIPMQLPGSKSVYKCQITGVVVNSAIASDDCTPSMIIIGAKKSPYIDGIAHHELNMFYRKDDRSGFGVIDAINSEYQLLNNLNRQVLDLTKPGRSGTIITIGDTDFPVQAQNIGDRQIINLKVNTRAVRSINDVMTAFPTDYNMINTIQNMLPVIENKMKLASRKGSSGEKMSPNPSATEFSQISSELQKSVNLVAININNFLKEWAKRAYVYTVMNTFESIKLNVQMERINQDGNLTTTDKSMDFEIPDLFIDNLKINLVAYDNFQNTAIQKQQVMQVTNLLYSTGTIINPQTGQPMALTDEAGTTYNISSYKLWKMILEKFNMSGILVKTNTNQQQMQGQQPMQPGQPMPEQMPQQGGAPQAPDLNANPDMSSILNQLQMSQGVNV